MRPAVFLVIYVLFWPGTASADPDFRAAVEGIRSAERLINAALQTGDDSELTTQAGRLLRIQSQLMDGSGRRDERRWACGMAAGDLATIVSLAKRAGKGDQPARSLVAAESMEVAYRRNLADCERHVQKAEKRR